MSKQINTDRILKEFLKADSPEQLIETFNTVKEQLSKKLLTYSEAHQNKASFYAEQAQK